MSYTQALRVSWALAREMFWWSALITLPMFVVLMTLRGSQTGADSIPNALYNAMVWLWLAIVFFFILPSSIRDAVSRSYATFRVTIVGPARRFKRLSYLQSLQLSLLGMALYACLGLLFPFLHVEGLLTLLQLPLVVLVIFPLFALVSVKVPFLGFRLSVISV